MKKLKLHDLITAFSLIVAALFLLTHAWQSVRPINYKVLEILSPVHVDKPVYQHGDTIKGEFSGERYVATPTLYTRMIQCEDFRAAIKPFKLDDPFVGEIFGLIDILQLDDTIFVHEQTKLPESARNCRLIFEAEHDLYKLPLGGYRTLKDNLFETTQFDIRSE